MDGQLSNVLESNGSGRSNRDSVWLKRATLVSDSNSNINLSDTYLLLLSLNSIDHDVNERTVLSDCDNFKLIPSLSDQPERRSMNYLMLRNSIYLSRCRYIANVGAIWYHLTYCVVFLHIPIH